MKTARRIKNDKHLLKCECNTSIAFVGDGKGHKVTNFFKAVHTFFYAF